MKNSLLVHKHLIIRAEASRPPTDEEYLKNWMIDFIESIDMKIFMGPYVKYCAMDGNRGITAVAIIETSHIAMHIWDEPKPALMQMDVYSCGEFDHHKIEYKYLNRETGLVDL
jgi:S-adenosylmethionine/arginine decarboxylase-like enzyme